jgi:hypothetical protein
MDTHTTLTPDQIALDAYIVEENAAFAARCEANGCDLRFEFALTAKDLAKFGVFNIAQYKQWASDNDAQESEKEERKALFDLPAERPTDAEISAALDELYSTEHPMSDAEIDELARLDDARRHHHHTCHEI